MTVLVTQSKLRLVCCALAASDALVGTVRARSIVGMYEAFPRADIWLDFVERVSQHLGPSRRIHDAIGFEVPVPDALERTGERQREPLLAFAQRPLGSFSLSDVAEDQVHRAGRLITQRCADDSDVN